MMLLFSQDTSIPICVYDEVESESKEAKAAVPVQPAITCDLGQPLHVTFIPLGLVSPSATYPGWTTGR